MKVLIVNVFRERGSTGKLISTLGSYLEKNGDQVIFAFRDGDSQNASNFKLGSRIESALTYRLNYLLGSGYRFAWISTARLMRIILKEKPDIVSFHSINGSYVNITRLIKWISHRNIPFTVTNHSEYLYTGNCTYSFECNKWISGCGNCEKLHKLHISLFFDTTARNFRRMKEAFSKTKHMAVISVSPWVWNRAKQSKIMSGAEHYVISNYVDENIYYPHSDLLYREQIANSDEKIIMYSSARFSDDPNDIKGGAYVLEIAKRLQGKKYKIVIAAIEVSCKTKLPDNVMVVGHITEQTELAKLYSIADVLLLTSKRETFSMPTAEAIMCGTPVVGFLAGGPESIALPQYSAFVEYGSIDPLIEEIEKFCSIPLSRDIMHKEATEKYGIEVVCKSYRELFLKLVQNKGRE